MTRTLEPAGPPQWTPGAGWERLKREMPQLAPELTDEDLRIADEIIAAAKRAERQTPSQERRAA
ncbi:hypothetical protein [Dactylosporangium sp. NPDC051484]|uniref:hypothetical protein n=1 Tax=Dactylosporangium sp. NPDC051484 TaxID=3154942 RepID=UPI00344F195B